MQEINNNANSYIRLSTQTIQPLLNEVIINQDPNQTFSDYFLKSLLSESFQHILQGLERKTTINPKIKSINDNEYIKVIKNIYASKSFSIESSDEITLNTAGLSNAFSVFSNKKMFLEYAPNVFSNLRIMSEIKESQWKESFDVIKNKDSISKIAGSEGKSSSLFFFTHDNKYIIKTIPERELKTFLKGFLKSYYEHNIENTNTLLVKIYGLFTFKSGLTKINLMVMENIAPFKTNQILYKFDLKGSLVGRETQNLLQNIQIKSLKDQDFLDLKEHSGELINPKKGDIAVIPEIIKGDTKTLADSNLMDYSLFIAIVEKERLKENDKEHEEESLYDSYKKIESENGKYYYYFGIIDYLTEFNFRKTLENSFKNLFVSQSDKDKFSAIKPGPYQVRFFDFLRTHVFVKERDKRGKLIHKKLKW
jgi:1-phosphatidylinositol-4-phosphate 5-kinase